MENIFVKVNHPEYGEDEFSFTPERNKTIDEQTEAYVKSDYPGASWVYVDEHGDEI